VLLCAHSFPTRRSSDLPHSQLGALFNAPVAPFSHIEMIRAPQGGMLLYHVKLGDIVKKDELLATIVTVPGDVSGDIELCAPQSRPEEHTSELSSRESLV